AEICIKCDKCSRVCPIVEVVPERKVYEVFFDEEFDPWLCCSCYRCELACPVGLSPREAMFKMRRESPGQRDKIPARTQKYLELVQAEGFVFPMDEWTNEDREDMGLPPLAIDEVARRVRKFSRAYQESRGGSGV
ncbi:MAG: 4Fe-4S dicluster domain-containing protein, partial [Promethearchaeota archaeon]